jgi:hypothetical protein
LWISLPKYICWEMCFARNWEIFQQEWTKPKLVVNRVISLLAEYINSRGFHLSSLQILECDEEI